MPTPLDVEQALQAGICAARRAVCGEPLLKRHFLKAAQLAAMQLLDAVFAQQN